MTPGWFNPRIPRSVQHRTVCFLQKTRALIWINKFLSTLQKSFKALHPFRYFRIVRNPNVFKPESLLLSNKTEVMPRSKVKSQSREGKKKSNQIKSLLGNQVQITEYQSGEKSNSNNLTQQFKNYPEHKNSKSV